MLQKCGWRERSTCSRHFIFISFYSLFVGWRMWPVLCVWLSWCRGYFLGMQRKCFCKCLWNVYEMFGKQIKLGEMWDFCRNLRGFLDFFLFRGEMWERLYILLSHKKNGHQPLNVAKCERNVVKSRYMSNIMGNVVRYSYFGFLGGFLMANLWWFQKIFLGLIY